MTYALLALAVLALWVPGGDSAPAWRRWVWQIVLAAAVAMAMATKVVGPAGLGWIAMLMLATYAFSQPVLSKGQRLGAAVVILGLSFGMMIHRLPGFDNLRVIDAVRFTPDAIPYTLYLNFDKTIAGILVLGWCHARITRVADARTMLAAAAPWIGLAIGVIMVLSLGVGFVRFDPKLPAETWLWLGVNLGFTCLAEEALFRGFVQAQLQRMLHHLSGGSWFALGLAAALFGIAHAGGGATYVALATVAGLGYGWIYQLTRRIEASILAHFTVNAVHFLFFTYPALQR